jgi:nucleotide-binding universal stress UspA family protein
MTLRSMLVPLETHDALPSVLQCALLFAKSFDCYIEGIALRPSYAGFIAVDPIGVAAFPELDDQVGEQAKQARSAFENFMRDNGVRSASDKSGVTCGWSAQEPMTEGGAGAYARVFDIAVLGRPASTENGPRMSVFETVLFESGRPILIAPPKAPATLGKTVLIAWNQSTETARATGFAMPVLTKADKVIVLTVTGGVVPGPSGAQLADQLVRNGIPATERTVQPGRRTSGETILTEANALGCDLIIKGAYTQSRLRQMIFGGATSHILGESKVPVFMTY